uniref:hypothetical protein n=1 Tax=Escherichia coli TaxID=562 RepID=UPI000D0A469B|nr:hypothetical protein [Escherichia coli]
MLPSETMIWQPEFTDKTLSRKPGAVQPLTVRRISDFADVADDFSCLAAAIDPELAEPPEEGIPMEGLNGTLFCFIQEEDE